MARKKSILGSFIDAAAKATDRAIKEAAKERARRAKAAEKARIQEAKELTRLALAEAKAVEKERVRREKELERLRNQKATVGTMSGRTAKAKSKAEADTINRTFRSSDHDRWQTQDFVVGFEIKRSGNCDCDCDLCKAGAGSYPKGFRWEGWHEGCKCYVVPILMTDDEFWAESKTSKNKVYSIPYGLNMYASVHPELHSADWYVSNRKMFD